MRAGCKLLVLGLAALSGFAPAHADWIAESDRHTLLMLEADGLFSPEADAASGLGGFDDAVMDLGPRLFERRWAAQREMLEELERRLAQARESRVRQDLHLLTDALRDDMVSAELRRRHLLPYFNLHKILFHGFTLALDPRIEPARRAAAMERLRKYTGQAAGYSPITRQAVERTAERFEVEGLVGPYIAELETDLGNAGQFVAGIRELFDKAGLEGWQDDLDVLEGQLADYQQWLQREMVPRARSSNLLPPAIYADNLRKHGVDATPEELISSGQYSYQLLRNEMKALARHIARQRGWEEAGLLPVIRRLKAEQVPNDRLLPLYRQRLAALEAIVRREDLVSLPEREAVIRVATPAESAAIPVSFMSAPQLINNTGQYGEFVLVQSNPALGDEGRMDDFGHEAMTWSVTAHEARPGHELQSTLLVENGISLARAVYAANSANSEGWGLYAESFMQPYLPLEAQLFNLYSRLLRAARMFLDPMVNTGRMSHQAARDFLVEELALSPAMAGSEADRYAYWAPGQATAYFYGYLQLMRLRTEVEVALGERFRAREFHDVILQQGLLPPPLLRAAVLEHFLPGTAASTGG
jgi:uncharacterized coiled-coil protein SlyX